MFNVVSVRIKICFNEMMARMAEEVHMHDYNDTNFISGHEYEANIVGTAESSGGC